jgi:2-phosphoglycerate kinase
MPEIALAIITICALVVLVCAIIIVGRVIIKAKEPLLYVIGGAAGIAIFTMFGFLADRIVERLM